MPSSPRIGLVRSGLVDRSMSIAMMLRWPGTLRRTTSLQLSRVSTASSSSRWMAYSLRVSDNQGSAASYTGRFDRFLSWPLVELFIDGALGLPVEDSGNPHTLCFREDGQVPEPASPTVRRRRLAAELRRLRERAGLTGDNVAEHVAWSSSKVSRIEVSTRRREPRRSRNCSPCMAWKVSPWKKFRARRGGGRQGLVGDQLAPAGIFRPDRDGGRSPGRAQLGTADRARAAPDRRLRA